MGIDIRLLPPTAENLERADPCLKGEVHLAGESRRRKQRRYVKVYQDRDGRYYVRDRLCGKRLIKGIRVPVVDGKMLYSGTAVLEGGNYP